MINEPSTLAPASIAVHTNSSDSKVQSNAVLKQMYNVSSSKVMSRKASEVKDYLAKLEMQKQID